MDFNSLASAYDAWFEEKGKSVFAIEVQAFKEVLSLLPKPWLEIGVGSGRFAQALGIECGLDPSTELLDMARNRGIDTFLSKGENAPFKDSAFGTTFIIVTLCFVDSPAKVLAEASRLLGSGGRLVLGLVLRESPWGQFYQLKKGEGHRFYKYANFYSYKDVKRLLEQTGFQIHSTVTVQSFPFVLRSLTIKPYSLFTPVLQVVNPWSPTRGKSRRLRRLFFIL